MKIFFAHTLAFFGILVGVVSCTTSESDPFAILSSASFLKALPDTCGTVATNPMGCSKERTKIAFVNTANNGVTMDFCVPFIVYDYGAHGTGKDYMGFAAFVFPEPLHIDSSQHGVKYEIQAPQSKVYSTFLSDRCDKGYALRIINQHGTHTFIDDAAFAFKDPKAINNPDEMVVVHLDLTPIYEAAADIRTGEEIFKVLYGIVGSFKQQK